MIKKARLSALILALCLGALGAPTVMAQAGAPASAGPARDDYRIGIEDQLRVFVWGEDDLSVRVTVRPDGKITVPLINDLAVVGLTANEVRQSVVDALAPYVREPTVSVIVEAINSYRVYFLGEINRQGAMNFYQPIRLLQAIAAAGGLTQFSKKEIVLLRESEGVERRIEIDYKKLLAGEPGMENIYLQPGDTLLVK